MMDWYSARLLYESVHYKSQGGERVDADEPLFEEKLIVFHCRKDEDIVAKLKTIADEQEHEYEAAAGNWVKWTFREILEIQEVMGRKITDGTEVFYRFWGAPDEHDFEMMRETATDPWWRSTDDTEAEDSN